MAPSRYYSSVARRTTLTADINGTTTSITVAAATGFPSTTPYTLIIDQDTVNEEIVEVTSRSGTTLTVTRGVDGTSGIAHTAGAAVEHGVSARDFADSRGHEAASEAVHGLGAGSAVVGETDTQTLTNKTLTSPTINGATVSGTVTGGTLSGQTITSGTLGSDLAAGSNKITGLADPTNAQDAATKNFVETGVTSQVVAATAQATAAATSATAAATSATAAATSATNAATSETNAATSATNAATSETNAATSATNAATSESNASTSETNAAASATAAATSATNAATSETNAATSATNAATSETNAAASSVSAANSAAAAAASYDQFDDRYLGQKSSAPSTDNDGDGLVTGALYYDTTAQEMRVYDGAGWLAASAASVVSLVTFEYTASAAQTAFTGADNNGVTLAYSIGLQQVFLNGVLLAPGDDYTTTDSGTITLASGAALNDYLIVCAFSSFQVANTYTQSQADALFLTQTSASTTYATKTELTSVEALALLGL